MGISPAFNSQMFYHWIIKKSVKIINEPLKNNDNKIELTKISYFQITTDVRSRNLISISAIATLFYRPAWFKQRSKIQTENNRNCPPLIDLILLLN
jgi:hypothetical protein